MTVYHVAAVVAIVFGIGYGALYKADDDRDPEREAEVGGVPVRFVSLMVVAFGSVLVLATAIGAPTTFAAAVDGVSHRQTTEVVVLTLKATSVGAVFSVVGAATADSVF